MKKLIALVLTLSLLLAALAVNPVMAQETHHIYEGGSITDTIVSVAEPGDTIIVHAGIYHESVVSDKNIILKGKNGAILDGEASREFGIVLWSGAASFSTIEGFEIRNYTNAGILLRPGCSGCLIKDNKIIDCNNGIMLHGAVNNMVEMNDVYGGVGGIRLFKAPGDAANQNTIKNNKVTGTEAPAIFISDNCSYNVVEQNDISDCGAGIFLRGEWQDEPPEAGLPSVENIVVNNKISIPTNGNGIFLQNVHDSVVEMNSITGGDHGIELMHSDNTTVQGNTVKDARFGGINVNHGWMPPWEEVVTVDNRILNNDVSAIGNGISLHNVQNTEVSGNKATGMVQWGIWMEGQVADGSLLCHSNWIINNDVSDSNQAIGLNSVNNTEVADNRIVRSRWGIVLAALSVNNKVDENQITGGISGIRVVEYSNYNHIIGNQVASADWAGIQIQAFSTNNLVDYNVVNGCGDGITMEQLCVENTIDQNDVKGSRYNGIAAYWTYDNHIDFNVVSGSGWFDLYDSGYEVPYTANDWGENNIYKTAHILYEPVP